jgi:predicted RNA binding protein YcfA (HicA-like mRNA interferase family)
MINQKKINRFKSKPKDFQWREMVALCKSLGFKEIQGRGSRVKFFHESLNFVICIHKPHPSKIVKEYVIQQVLNILEEKGLI